MNEVRNLNIKTWSVIALVLAVSVWGLSQTEEPQLDHQKSITALVGRCEAAMLTGVCGVMNGPQENGAGATASPAVSQEPAERIFVAGHGEIDPDLYKRLRSYGDGMCKEVQRDCEADWRGESCRTARALYPDT
jgi:hypothetical protein